MIIKTIYSRRFRFRNEGDATNYQTNNEYRTTSFAPSVWVYAWTYSKKLRDQVADAHFKVWDWTIDSLDWKYNKVPFSSSVPAIVNNVLSQANRNLEVVLLHDIHPQSIQALPIIIQKN
ncbi:hypothetical protein GCM10020331_092590 [Ectobacillus funiculus]